MRKGDKIICMRGDGYQLVLDKEYTVIDYDPPSRYEDSPWFQWPAYVVVEDDEGRRVYCHANRFKLKDA